MNTLRARNRNRRRSYWNSSQARRGAPLSTGPRRLGLETLEDRLLLSGLFTVTNTSDSGAGSLRQAIVDANATPNVLEPDRIDFNIGEGGPQTIDLLSSLPTITDPVVIDGTTQPGYVDSPIVEVDGIGTASPVLTIAGHGSGTDVQGLAMRTSGAAVLLWRTGGNTLTNLDLSWVGAGQSGTGIELWESSNNTIAYVTATNRQTGLKLTYSGNNVFEHNDFSGAGSWGVWTSAHGTWVGNQYLDNDVSDSANGVYLSYEQGMVVSGDSFRMANISGRPLVLDDVHNSHVSGLDVSWRGAGELGTGIELWESSNNTITYVTATNRQTGLKLTYSGNNVFEHNDFSGAGSWGVWTSAHGTWVGNHYLDNDVSDSANGVYLSYEHGMVLSGDSFEMTGIPGKALELHHVSDSRVSGLDLSWEGTGKSGTGIRLSESSNNIIEYVEAANRDKGLSIYHSGGNIVQHNDFSGAGAWGMETNSHGTAGGNQYLYNNVSDSTNGIYLSYDSNSTVSAGALDMTGIPGTALLLGHTSNSHIAGLDVSWTGTGKSGTGVSLDSSSNNTIEDVRAANRVYGFKSNYSGGNIVQHNDFSGAAAWGMQTNSHTTAGGNRYLYNDVSGSTNGIYLSYDSNSTVTAGALDMTAIPGTALSLGRTSNSHIAGLDVSWTGEGKSGTGVSLGSSANNTFEDVTASNRSTGIYFSSSSDNTIRCASILDNTIGVYVIGSSSGIVVNYNHIAGNLNGVANSATAMVNAENNYWGAADGPSNLGGSGDSYAGNVDADPFLTELPPYLVTNRPPVADAGGPYTVAVGGSVQLDASGTTDPDQPSATLTYEWDLDGDGLFGEEGSEAARGDETGITPTFSAAGLAGLDSVAVYLRVTDDGELWSEDTATIEIAYVSDLSVGSSDIAFSPANPSPGEVVTIHATITNQGLVDASQIDVSFFAFDAPLGSATIASLGAGASAEVSIPTSFPEDGFKLITVKADPANTILELNEDNNEASAVLQVGQPTVPAAVIVVSAPPVTADQGRPASVNGRADYDFDTVPGTQDFPVQGGQVTVTVIDLASSDVLGVFTGAHTDVNGNFSQGILAPAAIGTYTLLVEVTDNTATTQIESTLEVVEGTLPPLTPPPSVGGEGTDVFVLSEHILFSQENPDLGEPVTVFAFVQYIGAELAPDVAVTINDVFPVAGRLESFQVGSTSVDFAASPGVSTYVVVSLPWANTAEGAHVIQVVAEPTFPQNTGNDQASRLIFVGSPAEFLQIDKSVSLLVDADGNSEPTPGDTLEYTISFANTDTTEVTGAVILDDFDETLLETPFAITGGGSVSDGTLTWDVGTIAAGASGSVTYEVEIKPRAEFPRGITTVVNTALLDTDQTPPVAAMSRIDVIRPVDIDVKPGSDPNSINLNSKGVIPIAVFTTADFDAAWVDVSTVRFAGAEADHWALEDLDDDGDLDLILHFRLQETDLLDVYAELLRNDLLDGKLDDNHQAIDMVLTGMATDDDDVSFEFRGFDTLDLFLSGKKLKDFLRTL